ncbi:N-acetyltransferase [Rhodococcus rhodochrous]|uniref:N-acetyltransferase n=1 Tax=Rhodococcus rhodochrous TaxID=1829 RepID=A0AAW4XPH0_RHORH|nr:MULTISPECIES: GNAT family N-acetyltransferase [Rhodococcus]KLL95313.1 acetyltransferase [Rhodococcus sp. IITR03]MCD2114921.1 N-acetyltransferase [Rhodococcus rhodochrous]WAL49115.1 GNAT family N-acetyltransferase [Rhodococcus pyridinivorans]
MSTDTPDPRLTNITVAHAPERHRYELRDGDTVIGFTRYRTRTGSDSRRVFVHTEVDPAYGGLGLAARLVEFALDDVAAAGERIVPVCPYVAKYLRTHHNYDHLIDWPETQP